MMQGRALGDIQPPSCRHCQRRDAFCNRPIARAPPRATLNDPGSSNSRQESESQVDWSPASRVKGQLAAVGPQLGGLAASVAVATIWLTQRGRSGGGSNGAGSGGGGGGGGSSSGDGGPPSESAQAAAAEERRKREQKSKKVGVVNLTLVSFAVTRKAYERITQRFAREYEAATGQPVRFRLSFGGSGTQARAVCDGLPGDIVALALPLDVDKIREAGLIREGWQQRLPNNAIVAESVVAIVTRPGNPKNITGWDDLIRQDVDVITANPKTAGVARWNFFALWGHRLDKGEAAALDYTTKVFERVLVQPRDAREASDVFYKQNTGDVLLNYENEVIFTNLQYGEADAMPYVVPNNNVRVQTPVALVDKNADRRSSKMRGPTRAAAEAFLQYLFTPEAQAEFAACGFRPIDKRLQKKSKLPKVKKAWTVEDRLGGWDKSQKQFFGGGGVMDKIQRHVGEVRLKQRQEEQRRR
ncbi:g3025 [Coccomyxa elongata]